ncbi:PspC domain-containing protein [Cellulomonas rhizosphaerae]|uniref:PspC domain-containing protein n=1 Tax=Cellulomonas rhizosphaerae TaxID=2293719 RepID=A0A413RN61_9CELL|nr:PspC domain-containing protein [Cellulomonas rhizosphaerae]RHA43069.1 PspC domain-containing protein [Cellulomonas rhizosphaerae]
MDMHAPGDDTAGTPAPGGPGASSGTSSGTASDPSPTPGSGFFGAVRRLDVQRADDRWIGGVCAGLANRTGLDPLVWRGIFAASLLIGGLGLVLYGIAWALLPERRDGRIHLEELFAGRFDVAVLGALAFTVIGFGRGGGVFSLWFWGGEPGWVSGFFDWIAGLLWLGFVAAVVVVIVMALNRRESRRPPVPPGPYGPYGPYPARPATPAAQYPTRQASSPGAHHGTTSHGATAAPGTSAYPSATPYPSATAYPGATPYPGATGYPGPSAYPTAFPATAQAQPVPAPPARPAKPAKPHTPGPGVATVGIVVALSLIGLAVLLATDRTDSFTGPVALTAVGIAVVLAGLGIVVSGFRGRSSGFLGFLAIVGIVVALPLGAVNTSQWDWNDDGVHRFAGDVDLTVTSRSEAADGYALGFGQANLDLSGLPVTDELLEVPIAVGAGDVTVVVPRDVAVTADVRLRAGQITWDVDDTAQHVDGVSSDTRTFTDDASRAGSAQLDLQISVGAGNVTVIRENS